MAAATSLVAGGIPALQRLVAERSAVEPNRRAIYLLLDPLGIVLAGNLSRLARRRARRGRLHQVPGRRARRWLRPAQVAPRHGQGVLQRCWLSPAGRARRPRPRPVADSRSRRRSCSASAPSSCSGSWGGLILSRWMLTRLERINRSTAQIMAGEFGRRIATDGNGDEFDDLAQNLNAMLERIERLLAGMRQVSEDIAHDLRTPLNRMRSRIEVALMGCARPRGSARAARGHAAGRRRPDRDLQCAAGDRAGGGRGAAGRLGAAGPGRARPRRRRALRASGRGWRRSACSSTPVTAPSSRAIVSSWRRRSPTSPTTRSSTRRRAAP